MAKKLSTLLRAPVKSNWHPSRSAVEPPKDVATDWSVVKCTCSSSLITLALSVGLVGLGQGGTGNRDRRDLLDHCSAVQARLGEVLSGE